MNYCPNCGYHLAKHNKDTLKIGEPISITPTWPPYTPVFNPLKGYGTFPPNYGINPPGTIFSTVSVPPIMGHWGGSPLNEQVSFITGKDYGTKTSTKG